ncbi:glycosyltransferase family 4 protein [Pseudomonas sp. Hp2]|uniref:glycosyltransferase family 4 protein n=1 Tax=Pseudomonas sp. Hp2 TaxID=701189 RepID=UPI001127D977|nr:glycosyltransferase family 1 protein [Pseudomonas sp. Hp2]
MRLVIDLQGAQSESRYRGIGRYSLSLALAVARLHRGHDIHLALNGAFEDTIQPIRKAFSGLLPQKNIHVWHVPLPFRGMDRSHAERIRQAEHVREAAIAALAPDVVFISSLFEGFGDASVSSVGRLVDVPTVVTLYDLIPLMNPQAYLEPNPAYRDFYQEKLSHLRKADALVAISESAAGEARDVLKFDPGKVFNISGACDDVFRPMPKESVVLRRINEKFGIPWEFVLYTGGTDERKNLKRLVQAYAGLSAARRSTLRLVMAGRIDEVHAQELRDVAVRAGMRAEEIIFTGYVSDRDLATLYNRCRLFIFPSWHEGFGLPVLEAMNCGAAVLASDASSIREIATFKPATFDPMDVESIRECLARHIDDEQKLAELRAYSLTRGASFSWDNVANALLDACEQVHAQRPAQHLSCQAALERAVAALAEPAQEATVSMALADALDRSIPSGVPQIMVDVTELAAQDRGTGIQRVTRAVLIEWMKRPPAGYRVKPVRIDRGSGRYVYADVFASRFGGAPAAEDSPLVCHAGDVFLGLDLVGDVATVGKPWCEYFRMQGVRVAFVVYDILPIRHPEWWPGEGGAHHERWLRAAADCADQLICISRAVADDVRAWMDTAALEHRPELAWFHLGADIDTHRVVEPMPESGLKVVQRIRESTSFLMVGTLEPRKGHAQALAAFEQLWARGQDLVLVIVGKRGWMVETLCDDLAAHPELGKRLFWLDGIGDDYLARVYAASTCLLAASLDEGFGLPLIEAAQKGKPVLARDLPVFREVAGEHATYFTGSEPWALAQAVVDWIHARERGALPDIQALRWMTWQESASQLASVLLQRSGVQGEGG